ncbi:MAG: hypothetical protein IJ567_09235 [Lachnospiraceae bacterium]|nr:hypothetical protein [Lachnospiraceae bacterium]
MKIVIVNGSYRIKWKHIFVLLVIFLCMMAFMRYTALQVKVVSRGTGVLDLNVGNSVEHVQQTLMELGYDGRMYYLKHFLVVDGIYAMVYAIFYFFSIRFLLHKNEIRRKRVYLFSVFPIVGMLFDWLENLSLSFLLVNGTTEPATWCMLFRVSNILKFLFVYLSLLIVVLGNLGLLFTKRLCLRG